MFVLYLDSPKKEPLFKFVYEDKYGESHQLNVYKVRQCVEKRHIFCCVLHGLGVWQV